MTMGHNTERAQYRWRPHDKSAVQPIQSRGLDVVEIRTGAGGEDDPIIALDPRVIDWTAVQVWRVKKESSDKPAPQPVKQDDVQATLNERGKTHGDFVAQARTAQELKQRIALDPVLWERLTADQRGALQTIMMKVSRILHGNPSEPDHWRDIAGYATLVENTLVHGKSHLG